MKERQRKHTELCCLPAECLPPAPHVSCALWLVGAHPDGGVWETVGFSPPPEDGVGSACPPDLPEAAELRSLPHRRIGPAGVLSQFVPNALRVCGFGFWGGLWHGCLESCVLQLGFVVSVGTLSRSCSIEVFWTCISPAGDRCLGFLFPSSSSHTHPVFALCCPSPIENTFFFACFLLLELL